MDFKLDIEDYTIILNALHYYNKVSKKENFQQYDIERIVELKNKLSEQLPPGVIKNTIYSYISTAETTKTYRTRRINEVENIQFIVD